MPHLWQRIDPRFDPRTRPFLDPADECYYGCDFTKGGGFQASDCNSRIINLKHDPRHKGKPPWRHKQQAAAELASELAEFLPHAAAMCFIPSSKCKSDPAYDGRWEMVWSDLYAVRTDIALLDLFVVPQSVPSAHGGNRTGAATAIAWSGLVPAQTPSKIWLIDDVLTSGRHFEHCKRLILATWPTMPVAGVFWGRTVDPNPFAP